MANREILPSSFRYNNVETVDTVFSKILIGLLFKDNTFVPGVTMNDEYNERAGQIYMRKLGKPTITETTATSSGALDLVDTETADTLVLIQKKDVLSASEKCYEAVDELRASGKSVDKVKVVVETFREKCQVKWMSYLLATPAASDDVVVGGATRTADTTEDTTFAGLIDSILATREQIRANGGKADVVIVNPKMEALFLKNAISAGNAFVPETNEEMYREGKLGRLYGMNVYVSNLIGDDTPIAASGVAGNSGDAANCEYIIYDHRTFGVAADIYGPRLKESEHLFGSKAQVQGIMGGGVANPALAYAKVVA